MLSAIIIINSFFFFILNTLDSVLYTTSLKQFIADIKKSDNDTIHVVSDADTFKYAVIEKIMFYDIEKNIIFVEDKETSFNNGVAKGFIRGWY
jgi:hypothetical protein